jgi:hypothetical protein
MTALAGRAVTRQPYRPPLPVYRVSIARHSRERWIVPKQSHRLAAYSEDGARLLAIREAHRRLEMPPWRPLIRESLKHTTAKRTGSAPVAPIAPANCQLELMERMAA